MKVSEALIPEHLHAVDDVNRFCNHEGALADRPRHLDLAEVARSRRVRDEGHGRRDEVRLSVGEELVGAIVAQNLSRVFGAGSSQCIEVKLRLRITSKSSWIMWQRPGPFQIVNSPL